MSVDHLLLKLCGNLIAKVENLPSINIFIDIYIGKYVYQKIFRSPHSTLDRVRVRTDRIVFHTIVKQALNYTYVVVRTQTSHKRRTANPLSAALARHGIFFSIYLFLKQSQYS